MYAGNQKIEILIPGDTLGILLRDSINGATDANINAFDLARSQVQSALLQQGYQSIRYLDSQTKKILLVVGKKKNKTTAKLEDESKALADSNTSYIFKAGYLAYIKQSNKPLIITDEIIIKFNPGTTQPQINNIFHDYGLTIKLQHPYSPLEYTVIVNSNAPSDALKISQTLRNNSSVKYAQLNYFHPISFNTAPNYSDRQWSSENTGGVGSVDDADIDAEAAWNFTKGNSNTIIGVVDGGFDAGHDDLAPNLYYNPGEIPGNGADDDGNSHADDINGWNFSNNNNNLSGGIHGTSVLGVAAADDNVFGITGSCPGCRYLLGTAVNFMAEPCGLAIDYFVKMKVRIINISWSYDGYMVPDNIREAIAIATSNGILVLCAVSDVAGNYCYAHDGLLPDIAALPDVMGISASTCKDMFDIALSSGACISLLAPSGTEEPSRGAFRITTTDVRGAGGYNTGAADKCVYSGPVLDADYTGCFYGSSAATPLTAGVAGLILSANPIITAKQIQNLLQDCADKIEHSTAKYSPQNGKSSKDTHGYGRLNAYEAVKIASTDPAKGGRSGVDIFLRDNELDWGNTEKPSTYSFEPARGPSLPCWESMDIKVDAPDASSNFNPPADSKAFDDFSDESPIGGKLNKVYVRVRNRGFRVSTGVTVKLHWVHGGAGLPLLPSNFWDKFPADATVPSEWNSLGSKSISNLEYSGASSVISGDRTAQIVAFDFNAPVHDPSTRNHYCLMVIVSSREDLMPTEELKSNPNRLIMDFVSSHYNNATHRNYNIVTEDAAFSAEFFMYNPLTDATASKLEVIFKGQKIPVHFSDSLEGKLVYLKKNEKKLVRLNIDPGGLKEPTKITIQQIVPGKKKEDDRVLGGITYFIVPTSNKAASKNKK